MNRVKSLLVLKLSHDTILYTLNYTILYYSILFYTILYYSMLFYTVLYYILYYNPIRVPKKKVPRCLLVISPTEFGDTKRRPRGGLWECPWHSRRPATVGGVQTPVGMMTLPTEWKNKIHVPNNQPVIYKIHDMNLYKIMTHTYNYYSNKKHDRLMFWSLTGDGIDARFFLVAIERFASSTRPAEGVNFT